MISSCEINILRIAGLHKKMIEMFKKYLIKSLLLLTLEDNYLLQYVKLSTSLDYKCVSIDDYHKEDCLFDSILVIHCNKDKC
ncbi:hypothetical protein DW202_04935 [Coprobacillus sp. AM17-34]|nr:hypothetical protein DW202_04935 [Coprobacillus sp. AM17-34]